MKIKNTKLMDTNMSQFQLNLNVNPLVYFPAKSNQPLEIKKVYLFQICL